MPLTTDSSTVQRKSALFGRRFLFLFTYALTALSLSAMSQEPPEPIARALFVSVVQDPLVLSSRDEIGKLIQFAKQARIRTLYVQIYYANKAWFRSKVGDSAPYGAGLRDVGEDPFALLIRKAHAAGIKTFAWLNVLSLNDNENAPMLKKYGVGILTKDKNRKTGISDYKIDKQYFLEPGDLRVREELAKMVHEVLSAYPDMDGILLDYLRYPDVHPVYGYATANMDRFKKATGSREIKEGSRIWNDWRRSQVTAFTELLVKQARTARPEIRIAVTGCMPWARAYHEAFQDWLSWIDRGIVDFVVAMNYSPVPETFGRWIQDVKLRTAGFKKVHFAVGAYKLEKSPEFFAKEFQSCESSGSGGCAVFHYGSFFQNPALQRPLFSDNLPENARDEKKSMLSGAPVFRYNSAE